MGWTTWPQNPYSYRGVTPYNGQSIPLEVLLRNRQAGGNWAATPSLHGPVVGGPIIGNDTFERR
jgi:hypothetical protein